MLEHRESRPTLQTVLECYCASVLASLPGPSMLSTLKKHHRFARLQVVGCSIDAGIDFFHVCNVFEQQLKKPTDQSCNILKYLWSIFILLLSFFSEDAPQTCQLCCAFSSVSWQSNNKWNATKYVKHILQNFETRCLCFHRILNEIAMKKVHNINVVLIFMLYDRIKT